MCPILPVRLLHILLFLAATSFIPGAPAVSVQMTRRQTGQEHSHLIKRLIADSPHCCLPPRRKSTGAGIGRRAIVKDIYRSKIFPRQEGASETASGSAANIASESAITSQSDFQHPPLGRKNCHNHWQEGQAGELV